MKSQQYTNHKIHSIESLLPILNVLKYQDKKIVFTNGCFDILHLGHIKILNEAAAFGNFLIVALNTDASVKKLKGDSRPIQDEQSRATIMANLTMVDAVILFDDETPLKLIQALLPNVLVKGGDYTIDQIVGAQEVIATGGTVEIIPILKGFSTTSTIEKKK
jgi:D-glycero-beta-D-manno-heptose 1-phosphate adenylyltransferase